MGTAAADLVIRSRRVVLPSGTEPAAVVVSGGSIAAVLPYDSPVSVDLGDVALLPGLVDSHVHVNEPGRTSWEGFASATRAALAGGITTICDMPLNSLPPTVSVPALREKQAAASGQCWTDVAFWGGVVPGSASSLAGLHEAGVVGFKCFLTDSGVPEFPPLTPDELRAAMTVLGPLDALLAVHAEDPAEIAAGGGGDYGTFMASRPPKAERRAIEHVVRAASASGGRAHIVHLAAAECAALLAGAAGAGIRLTAETCPHYLYFAAEQVPAGATEFKCCPPIRDEINREALWRALEAGVISCVVSDHSPCPASLKAGGDFGTAWGGIASVQLSLAAVWTVARQRGRSLDDVVRWMASSPAALTGLSAKGRISVGCDADLVAFDPDESWVVTPSLLYQRHPVTPYSGRKLTGSVRHVWLRGMEVSAADSPRGMLLERVRG
jgi:allantoinase